MGGHGVEDGELPWAVSLIRIKNSKKFYILINNLENYR
jgi:hypothetical protein